MNTTNFVALNAGLLRGITGARRAFLGLAGLLMLMAGCGECGLCGYPTEFTRERWVAAHGAKDEVDQRACMLESLLDTQKLVGLSRGEIEQLLGPEDGTIIRTNPPDIAYAVDGDLEGSTTYLAFYLDDPKLIVVRVAVIRDL